LRGRENQPEYHSRANSPTVYRKVKEEVKVGGGLTIERMVKLARVRP
jgi:hypothetical protein